MTSIQQTVNQMLKRAIALHGVTPELDENGQPTGAIEPAEKVNKEFLKMLATAEVDPKKQAELIIAAWDDKTGAAQRSLNAIRVETTGNFIAAESMYMSGFFESVTLAENEQPAIVNESENEVSAGYIGEDGQPDRVRVVKPNSSFTIGLALVSSKWVKYKTQDIYKGRVDGVAKATIDISRDLTFKVDRMHYDLLNQTPANGGCFGAFSFEQTKSRKEQRIYVAHSGIVTSHFPATNSFANGATSNPNRDSVRFHDLDPAATSATGFRPAVLAAIVDYADRWGNYLPNGGGRLVPTGEIIVPSSDIYNIAKFLAVENGKDETDMQREVQQNGYTTLRHLGRQWKFIPDVTIESGFCYPVFSGSKPGRSFNKPFYSREMVKQDDDQFWEMRKQTRLYGAHIVSQDRPRAMKITYTGGA